jgi:hypothetical protein
MAVVFLIVAALATAYILIEFVTPSGSSFLWWATALSALGFGIWAVLEALILGGVISHSEESG